jgi:hypothetical protein
MTFLAGWYPESSKEWFLPNWWVSGDFPYWFLCCTKIWKCDIPFGVISAKFQIQQVVMVLIQYLTKKITWGKLDENP